MGNATDHWVENFDCHSKGRIQWVEAGNLALQLASYGPLTKSLLQGFFNVLSVASLNTGPRILRPHPTDVGCVFMIPHNRRTFRLGGVVPLKVENLGPISIPREPSGIIDPCLY